MQAVGEVRKALIWGVPFLVGLAVACGWLFFGSVIPSTRDLLGLAPVVRVGSMGYLTPFVGAIAVLTMVLLILKAIPYQGKAYKLIERANLGFIFGAFILMVLILCTSALVQNHYLPKLGYSKCTELQGNPTMWFTDWVKNPEWCVEGKTREWVNEQARLSGGAKIGEGDFEK